MRLISRCPHCGELIPLTREELRAAWPQMACPGCRGLLDPLEGLLGEERGAQRRQSAALVSGPHTEQSAGTRRPLLGPLLGGLCLLLLLLGQSAWWARGMLIQSPTARSLLEGVCQALGCQVPLPRLPAALVVTERQLQPDPEHPERWRLRLGLRNQAPVPQALPLIELELYDLREKLQAVGRFPPEAYASPGLPQAIAPQGTISLSVEIAAPDPEPSGFRLRFL